VLDDLEVPSELILAPAGHMTPDTGAVTELVAELVPAGGEAGSVDVLVVEVDPLAQSQHGQVVTETFGIVPGVDDGTQHVVLLMSVLLATLFRLWAAVITLAVPLELSLLKFSGMMAQLPTNSLFVLRMRQVQGNSPGEDSPCPRPDTGLE